MSDRIVFQALYESEKGDGTEGVMIGGRRLFIVANNWTRAASKAAASVAKGETLVSLGIAKDAAVV